VRETGFKAATVEAPSKGAVRKVPRNHGRGRGPDEKHGSPDDEKKGSKEFRDKRGSPKDRGKQKVPV